MSARVAQFADFVAKNNAAFRKLGLLPFSGVNLWQHLLGLTDTKKNFQS
jgi:hypothetical protein